MQSNKPLVLIAIFNSRVHWFYNCTFLKGVLELPISTGQVTSAKTELRTRSLLLAQLLLKKVGQGIKNKWKMASLFLSSDLFICVIRFHSSINRRGNLRKASTQITFASARSTATEGNWTNGLIFKYWNVICSLKHSKNGQINLTFVQIVFVFY